VYDVGYPAGPRASPVVRDGKVYTLGTMGHLHCLEAATGKVLWRKGFQEDRFFLFNEKGDLIIARLTPQGYDEISRSHVIEPTNRMPGRPVVWSYPAFANRSMYVRNDKKIVCVSLAAV
jgi:hypothetical protein